MQPYQYHEMVLTQTKTRIDRAEVVRYIFSLADASIFHHFPHITQYNSACEESPHQRKQTHGMAQKWCSICCCANAKCVKLQQCIKSDIKSNFDYYIHFTLVPFFRFLIRLLLLLLFVFCTEQVFIVLHKMKNHHDNRFQKQNEMAKQAIYGRPDTRQEEIFNKKKLSVSRKRRKIWKPFCLFCMFSL